MRPHIREFVRISSEVLPLAEPVVEIGSRLPQGQEKLADLRPFFADKTYIGCDMIDGPGVDRVEFLEGLSFSDGEVGTFLFCDTLEHVKDLSGAIGELRRCLDKVHGIVIATSVLAFPIHGYPNDYWRFTPEGFRTLFEGFEATLVYYAGDPNLPHTVCVVAGARDLLEQYREGLATKLASQKVLAPHHTDSLSRAVMSAMARQLAVAAKDENAAEAAGFGFTGALLQEGWILYPGAWIQAEIKNTPEVAFYRLRSDTAVLMELRPDDLNIRSHESGKACFQFGSTVPSARLTRLHLEAVSAAGSAVCVARSSRGLLFADIFNNPAFLSHQAPVDKTSVAGSQTEDEVGVELVDRLHKQGQKIVVDLGCGFRKKGSIGIDSKRDGTEADIVCLLGFDRIPLEDGSADEVVCRDFLEHLPKAVFLESRREFHYPIMYLMDEIWRILKPGGLFTSWTPVFPHPELFQDPTHLSAWTMNSMGYFCGEYPVARRIYGVRACFEKLGVSEDGFYLHAQLRKPQGTS
jgi:hypothetical protein